MDEPWRLPAEVMWQGSARKDVVFGAARGYTFTVPGPKWKSWLKPEAGVGPEPVLRQQLQGKPSLDVAHALELLEQFLVHNRLAGIGVRSRTLGREL